MDVKSSFFNEFINEEVYVSQSPNFEDHENPDFVLNFKQALCGLKKLLELGMSSLVGFLLRNNLIMAR